MPPLRKPKGVRKTDGVAQVEAFITNVSSGKASAAEYSVLAALVVGAVAIGGGCYYVLRSHVSMLSAGDSLVLKEVFYSGEPWVVECTKGRPSPIMFDAEGSLAGVKMGGLDCSAVLPSGKTTFERFKLREPSYGPVILAAANGERPQIAPRNVLSTGSALASWARGATASKVWSPTSAEQFESQCARKPWCLVVLSHSGRLVDAERAALQRLAAAHRRVRVVKIDNSKASLMADLPGGLPTPTASAASVVLLKQLAKPAAATSAGGADAEDGADADETTAVGAAVLPSGLAEVAASEGDCPACVERTA